jgi:phosphoglucosamine mutase
VMSSTGVGFMGRKFFGTDGIRGKANVYPMTGEVAMSLGRAVTSYFQKMRAQLAPSASQVNQRPVIVIGKDTRLSCYMLEHAIACGVCSQGGRAILTGPLPTAGVAFATQSMRADAGIMISASHNPYSDNGIKIFDHTGHKLPDQIELELERMMTEPGMLEEKVNAQLGNAKRLDEVIGRYIVQAKGVFNARYNLTGLRLVVDCANGAAYKVAPMIFEELGGEVIPLAVTPNGININEQCGALHPQNCARNVVLYRADVGICLDGDADRIVMIDEKGKVVDGDQLIGLMAKYLVDTGAMRGNKVIGTVMTNGGVERYLKSLGLELVRTKVGDRYIVEKMLESNANFGGEPSGHVIFKDLSTTGDGIVAALKTLECMLYYKRPLSELISGIELFPQVIRNVKVSKRIPFEDVAELNKEVKKVEDDLGPEGRVLLRYSGTENLARVMVEGENQEHVQGNCDHLASMVSKFLGH